MSAPTKAETLEEFCGTIDASPEDIFQVWFSNHAPEELQIKISKLLEQCNKKRPDAPFANQQALAIDLLDDVVDVWMDEYKD